MDLKEFLLWEQATRDCIDVKKIYVDMADDLVAGILLSQIVYWNLPDKEGKTKLRVKKDGQLWLVKGREDWWDECRINPRQFDTAFKKLLDQGLVEKKVFKFAGNTRVHIRIIWENFFAALQMQLEALEIANAAATKAAEETAATIDTAGIHESVIPDLHGGTLDFAGIYKSVNPELQNPLIAYTESTVIDSKIEREREDAANAAPLSAEPNPEDELQYELLKEITKRVFGMPKADQINTVQLWNRWQEQFPHFSLTHIYAILSTTQQTARPKDDIMGIVMQRLPYAQKALVPIKMHAIDYVADIRKQMEQA